MAVQKHDVDMINGPLWGKILSFAAVYMLTAVLQHLYSAADVIIVGRYGGEEALAGVGTCTVVVNLFVNFIMGFSAAATIAIGHAIGSKNRSEISNSAHTSIAVAIVWGFGITLVCFVFAKNILGLIDVPKNVMGQAKAYLKIVSLGFIPSLIYNFGAAILRAKGDNKRALYIVTISGIINVVLNFVFVKWLGMKASGVALATVISQVFTAITMLWALCHQEDETKIILKKIRIYKAPFLKITRVGLPLGIQSSVYCVSNMIVQGAVNGFGAAAVAGSSACTSITDFYNVSVTSLYQASIVFVSQNFGARRFDRIKKVVLICQAYVICLWAIQSVITFFFGEFLIGLYVTEGKEVIEWGVRKINILGYCYGILGMMNVMSGALRGIGSSLLNTIASVCGVCGIRILWIFTVFRSVGTFESLFYCYPLSWAGTLMMHTIMFTIIYRIKKRKTQMELGM